MVLGSIALAAAFLAGQPAQRCLSKVLPADGTRRTTLASKGVELYSWRADNGTMLYSLLWGTNRLKAKAEVKSPACALSKVAEVEAVLSRLAIGERVFWMWTAQECPDCIYPPADTVAALVGAAKKLGLEIETPSKGSVEN